MKYFRTIVVNLFGGPGSGKTVKQSDLFSYMKKIGLDCERVDETAKVYVRRKKWDELNNQYMLSKKYYETIKAYEHEVNFIILDASLLIGLYHNETNEYNTSDKEKTKQKILEYYNSFSNVNIFLNRKGIDYEENGRIETMEKACEIDNYLKNILVENNYPFAEFKTSEDNTNEMLKYILSFIPIEYEAKINLDKTTYGNIIEKYKNGSYSNFDTFISDKVGKKTNRVRVFRKSGLIITTQKILLPEKIFPRPIVSRIEENIDNGTIPEKYIEKYSTVRYTFSFEGFNIEVDKYTYEDGKCFYELECDGNTYESISNFYPTLMSIFN